MLFSSKSDKDQRAVCGKQTVIVGLKGYNYYIIHTVFFLYGRMERKG